MRPLGLGAFGLLIAALLCGCSTEIVDISTVVCQPGTRKCDSTSTRVLECHPNGAAWVLVKYCTDKNFCVNGSCTGDDDDFQTNPDAILLDGSQGGEKGEEDTSDGEGSDIDGTNEVEDSGN